MKFHEKLYYCHGKRRNFVFFHFYILMYCKMFNVVVGDNWCSVVPQTWIDTSNKICSWPLHNTNITKAIKKLKNPDTSWEKIEIKYILGPYESYKIARNIVMHRIRIKDIPDPPSNYKTSAKESNENTELETLEIDEHSIIIQNNNDFDNSENYDFSQPLDYGDFFSQNEPIIQELTVIQEPTIQERSEIQTRKLPPNPSHGQEKQLLNSAPKLIRNNYELQTLQKPDNINEKASSKNNLNEAGNLIIEKYLIPMNKKLDTILLILNENCQTSSATESSLDLLPSFPLHSVEEFKHFCTELQNNDDLRKQFQKKIRIIGGKTAEKHLTNSLIVMLTNKLAKTLTWDGQRQTEGIKDTMFSNIIIANLHI